MSAASNIIINICPICNTRYQQSVPINNVNRGLIPFQDNDPLCHNCAGQLSTRKKSKRTIIPDYYLDENGFTVFTAQYHLNRGYCCRNNCRHCPY